MCRAMEDMRNQALQEGLEAGRKEGIQKGKKEGRNFNAFRTFCGGSKTVTNRKQSVESISEMAYGDSKTGVDGCEWKKDSGIFLRLF